MDRYPPIAEHGLIGDLQTAAGTPERRAFTQHDKTEVLDASLLMLPLVGFLVPTDCR